MTVEISELNVAERRGYRWRKILPAVLVAVYPAFAFLVPHEGRAEFYPFFTWDLFSHTSNHKGDAVIIVHSIDGEALGQPTLLIDLQDRFAAATNIKLAKLLDNIVIAHWQGDIATPQALQPVIETTYLKEARALVYDVAIIRYDPLKRYLTGEISSIETIASFEKASS